jgi:hypothetical protein
MTSACQDKLMVLLVIEEKELYGPTRPIPFANTPRVRSSSHGQDFIMLDYITYFWLAISSAESSILNANR